MQSHLIDHFKNNFQYNQKNNLFDRDDLDPNFYNIFEISEMVINHSNFIENFYPSTKFYYSPLNHLFLYKIKSLDEIKGLGTVLARDGLLPLLWFFEKFSPPSFSCKIFIDDQFKDFIPDQWRPYLGTFHLISKKKSINISPPSKLFLHCLVTKRYLTIKKLRNQLNFVKSEIERQNLEIKEVEFFISFRDDPYYRKECDQFNALITKEILNFFKNSVKFPAHKDLFNKKSYREYKISEVGQRYFVADNFINYLFLSRGAEILTGVEENGSEEIIDLSPFHAVKIRRELPDCHLSGEVKSELLKIKETALASERDHHFSLNYWPESFIRYVAALAAVIK